MYSISINTYAMGMIKEIWDTSIELFNESDKLKAQQITYKQSLAELLGYISSEIKDTYDSLVKGEFPGSSCLHIQVLSDELFRKTLPVLGEQYALRIAKKLKEAHDIKKLHTEFSNGTLKSELAKLHEASEYFKTISKSLLV